MTDLSEHDYRLIGAKHEAARIIVWVRAEIGRLREVARLTPERHVRRHKQLKAVLAPLQRLNERIEKEWGFAPKHQDVKGSIEKETACTANAASRSLNKP